MRVLQPVRGTHDILPEEFRLHRLIGDTGAIIASRFGFEEISTPIFEFSEVFKRTLGDSSDIVTKEMYSFEDKGGDKITLRPEGTAGVARMLISGGLAQKLPLKYFYRGPMFRYERPQKGRYRQFHQLGAELLGVSEPQADIEMIALGALVLEALAITANLKLQINTLGNMESRAAYREALIKYFSTYRSSLSVESQMRLDRNPLRILDSKEKEDRSLIENAPEFSLYLDRESQKFFEIVCEGLELLSIEYSVNQRLVRGLDYYSHTAFEFTTDELGAQGTVLAGGRYDGLVEQMGGAKVSGVGWAAGIERLGMLVEKKPEVPRPIAIIPVTHVHNELAILTAYKLRRSGLQIELAYRGNMSKRLKRANRLSACAAIFLGGDEMERGFACVRDLDSGTQMEVPLVSLVDHLGRYRL